MLLKQEFSTLRAEGFRYLVTERHKENKMARQSRKRLDQLIATYPAIAKVRSRGAEHEGEEFLPVTTVYVQKPDPDVMYMRPSRTSDFPRSYVFDSEHPGKIAYKVEYMEAINRYHNSIYSIFPNIDSTQTRAMKDIFTSVEQERVDYILYVTLREWYDEKDIDTERDELFSLRDKGIGTADLTIIVYPRRKDMSWQQLVETAEREKKEREEAYLYNPKVMPALAGVHTALRKGYRLHAFLSGGGLRVVSLSKEDAEGGYGEHPHIEEALIYLDEDYLAGGRPYQEVYGKLHTHYLTGSTLPTSNLDWWIRKGSTFDCWQEGNQVVFRLNGYSDYPGPDWAKQWTEAHPYVPVYWFARGFMFEMVHQDGERSSMRIFTTQRKDTHRAFFYKMTKTGTGSTLWEAMFAAFAADPTEVNDSD